MDGDIKEILIAMIGNGYFSKDNPIEAANEIVDVYEFLEENLYIE